MKKWVLAAVAAIGMAVPASAAVITLQSETGSAGNFTFNYQGTLGSDEGVVSGNRLIIYDFAGYIPGSIFTPSANVIGTVENTSSTPIFTPGFSDDPNLPNLVFTYVGPDFRNTGGPFTPFDFNGLGARSTLGGTIRDAFFTQTVKNNPPAEENTALYQVGSALVPFAAVPEPATWAMMLGGFGLLGAAMRRRRTTVRVAA